jgi:nucleotide-binding universal stress UspA family protein
VLWWFRGGGGRLAGLERRYNVVSRAVQSLDLVWTDVPTVRKVRAETRRSSVAGSYRRLLVPVHSRDESFHAFDLACRLAADEHARITALAVTEVPALLPLDAHLRDEEEAARQLLDRAGAIGDAYGVKVTLRLVRARDFGAAIVQHALSDRTELIVVGAPRAELTVSSGRATSDQVLRIMKGAPCRVMVVTAPSREAA